MPCQYHFESIKQWDKWMRRCLPLLNLSAVSAFDSPAAQSHTDANFNQQSQTCLLRLNLWLPMTLGKLILLVRSVLWYLNIPQEAATLLYEDNDGCNAMGNAQKPTPWTRHMISNMSPCVNGLSVTLSFSIGSILWSTCPTTSPNLYRHFSFIDALISFSVMYLWVTLLYIPLSVDSTPTTPSMSTNLHLRLSLPHLQPLRLEFMHQLRMILLTALGCKFSGMVIQSSVPMIPFSCLVSSITWYTLDCGGVLP